MERHYDGDRLLEDVSRALEEALGKHGVQVYSLLGVTTVLEAIASPLKFQVQTIAGHALGRLGCEAYYASTIPRRIALLQSPHSITVNPMMESIAVALMRAKAPLDEEALRLAAYRVMLARPRATKTSAEKENSSLVPAFLSARDYLAEGQVISQDAAGRWRLNELWEMAAP
ncbi:hypothetical protein ACTTAL_17465 [Rhodobacter capsulatus]|uniref:hypothetical protein n=1 Tax=Rhodobacter capsulatus TaxID=1061 RepID=UPI0003D31E37|nr:hypothetical protein [Rhodobacter capsulatus]ETD87288.1 hypothetical protein U713_16840 [Rhodobacter capsulatus YW2]